MPINRGQVNHPASIRWLLENDEIMMGKLIYKVL